MSQFKKGFRAVFPIVSGIVPFGLVAGSVFYEAQLSFTQSLAMNLAVYAGAAQMAAVNLMKSHSAVLVVVLTGLIINMRFLLYSLVMSTHLKGSHPFIKFICAFTLTDQSYATMANHQNTLKTDQDAVQFYLGTAACMMFFWQLSFIAGFAFGNFAPEALSLDFAVPLSFVALLIPAIKSKSYVFIAILSASLSVLLHDMPFRSGLITSACLAIGAAWFIIKRSRA